MRKVEGCRGLAAIVGMAMALVACHGGAANSQANAGDANEQSGEDVLLGLAADALKDHRLVAPQGSNVYEFELSVLQLDPHNDHAWGTLHANMPDAMHAVEQSIDARQLDEAERELSLLREVEPESYKLALLGGKLDAYRQLQIREDEARAARLQNVASQ